MIPTVEIARIDLRCMGIRDTCVIISPNFHAMISTVEIVVSPNFQTIISTVEIAQIDLK
jgi:hypothetical protein